jgi:hypothetical protein
MVRARDYTFIYGKGNKNNELGIRIFIQHRTLSTFKRVEFVRYTISYILLRDSW